MLLYARFVVMHQVMTSVMPISALAIRYLCVPGTSASSERTFSNGGNTVTDKRSSLTGDHVSDLIVLKGSWGKVESFVKKRKLGVVE
jgi:hypothetical protein